MGLGRLGLFGLDNGVLSDEALRQTAMRFAEQKHRDPTLRRIEAERIFDCLRAHLENGVDIIEARRTCAGEQLPGARSGGGFGFNIPVWALAFGGLMVWGLLRKK